MVTNIKIISDIITCHIIINDVITNFSKCLKACRMFLKFRNFLKSPDYSIKLLKFSIKECSMNCVLYFYSRNSRILYEWFSISRRSIKLLWGFSNHWKFSFEYSTFFSRIIYIVSKKFFEFSKRFYVMLC